jgi:hypothetical protein
MGFFNLFRRRRKASIVRKNKGSARRVSETLRNIQTDMDQLLSRIGTVDVAIKNHEEVLAAHETRLQEHGQRFQTLEQKVTLPVVQPMTFRQAGRHATENNPRLSGPPTHASSTQQFDIEHFTEQQKRVLAVFFQNKGIRMSYADVAKVLTKSAYTIKNQMNQIRQKADLFDCTIGNQSRNLFALKADLRVEKYLKVGQPNERPVSMPERDQSEAEEAEPVVEYSHERSEPQEEG